MKRALLLASLVATSAFASVDHYKFTGVFWHSDVPASIAAGDRFTLTFDYHPSAVDANPDLQSGVFFNAISNLKFSLNSGSSGDYAGGSMSASQFLQLTDNWFGYDMVNFYASPNFVPTGLDFGPAGADPFVEFTFNLYSNSQDVFSLTAPMGETLGSVLPVLDLAAFDNTASVNLVFGDWDRPLWAFANITSVSTPDAPAYLTTFAAAAFLIVMLAYARRLRRVRVTRPGRVVFLE